jgi:mRNA-degrading endonuclease RelE of RelBE toxin-antitoxin system
VTYRFILTERFRRDLQKLEKKNPKLDSDLETFLDGFDHAQGDFLPGTGGAQKIRMKISGRGKSSSYRVVYFFQRENNIFLLTVYSKQDKGNLSSLDKEVISAMIAELKK